MYWTMSATISKLCLLCTPHVIDPLCHWNVYYVEIYWTSLAIISELSFFISVLQAIFLCSRRMELFLVMLLNSEPCLMLVLNFIFLFFSYVLQMNFITPTHIILFLCQPFSWSQLCIFIFVTPGKANTPPQTLRFHHLHTWSHFVSVYMFD